MRCEEDNFEFNLVHVRLILTNMSHQSEILHLLIFLHFHVKRSEILIPLTGKFCRFSPRRRTQPRSPSCEHSSLFYFDSGCALNLSLHLSNMNFAYNKILTFWIITFQIFNRNHLVYTTRMVLLFVITWYHNVQKRQDYVWRLLPLELKEFFIRVEKSSSYITVGIAVSFRRSR